MAKLMQTDIPGYQNFVEMPPAFFDLIEECIHYRIKKSVANFRKPTQVEIKTGNNAETPGNRRNVHLLIVSLAGWPKHHM